MCSSVFHSGQSNITAVTAEFVIIAISISFNRTQILNYMLFTYTEMARLEKRPAFQEWLCFHAAGMCTVNLCVCVSVYLYLYSSSGKLKWKCKTCFGGCTGLSREYLNSVPRGGSFDDTSWGWIGTIKEALLLHVPRAFMWDNNTFIYFAGNKHFCWFF